MDEKVKKPDENKGQNSRSSQPSGNEGVSNSVGGHEPVKVSRPSEDNIFPQVPLKPESNQGANPEGEKESFKEPWQQNEDIQEKLSKVSSEFDTFSLKKEDGEKPSVTVQHESREEKKTFSGSGLCSSEIKKIAHHPLSLFIILGVVGFGLAALLFSVLARPSAKKNIPKTPSQESSVMEIITPADISEEAQKPLKGEPAGENKEVSTDKPVPVLTLSGIIFDETGSLALINGRVVKEGYMIEGAKLEKVYPDKVELSFEGKKIILRSR